MTVKITTETGKEMLSSVTPAYNEDDYALSIFEANGKAMDDISNVVKQTRNQIFPYLATWTIDYWEESLGLSKIPNLSIEERRNRVVTKIRTYFPVTKNRMEIIASSAAKAPASIPGFVDDYIFELVLGISDSVNLVEMINKIEEAKPAHLDFVITQKIEQTVNQSAVMQSGETITVYPYRLEQINITNVENQMHIAMQSGEEITVYPG